MVWYGYGGFNDPHKLVHLGAWSQLVELSRKD